MSTQRRKPSELEDTSAQSVEAIHGDQELGFPPGPFSYRREILSLQELDSAIDDERVTLAHIVMARYLSQQLHNPAALPEERAAYNERVGRLLETYAGGYEVNDRHFCSYIPAAVVLRRFRGYAESRFRRLLVRVIYGRSEFASDTIDMVYLPEAAKTTDVEIEATIWRARGLYLEATQRRGERRSFLTRAIYSLVVYLLSLADAQAISQFGFDPVDPERTARAAPKATAELIRLEVAVKNAALTEARQDYLIGMFAGVIFLGTLVGVLLQFISPTMKPLMGIVAAGGLGATLSVMSRLTANRLKVDAGAGTALIRLAGGFRPLVGAIFGLALYIFIEADLFPIKLTVTGLQLTYFYLAVAFLAGFSERFAQDAVTKAGAAISSDTSPVEDRAEGLSIREQEKR
jgi:hypothetical protein